MVKNMKPRQSSKWLCHCAFAIFEMAVFALSGLLFIALIRDRLEGGKWIFSECCVPLLGCFLFSLTIHKRHWIFANDSRFLIFMSTVSVFIFFEAIFWTTQVSLYGTAIAFFCVTLALLLGGFLLFSVHHDWNRLSKIARNIGIFGIALFTWFGTVDATIYYETCPICHEECQTLRIRILCCPIYSKVLTYCKPASVWQFPDSETCLHSFTATPKVRLIGLIIPIYLDIGDEYIGMFSEFNG